jgi:hypothetical protein
MSETEKIAEWVRYYNASLLKFGSLRAIYKNDGPVMLENVLKALKLKTAADVVKGCDQ